MNEKAATDRAVRNEDEARRDEISTCSRGESSAPHRCQHCRVSRWYPPMLLASTALTAVFFWMYITKPVFFPASPPAPESTTEGQELIREAETTPYLASQHKLDPWASTLPGEVQGQPVGVEEEEISGDRLRPLIVKRSGPSLFRPFNPEASSGRSAGETDSGIRESEPVSDKRPERVDVSGGEDRSPDNENSSARLLDSGHLQVHASIMGEFMVSEQLGRTKYVVER